MEKILWITSKKLYIYINIYSYINIYTKKYFMGNLLPGYFPSPLIPTQQRVARVDMEKFGHFSEFLATKNWIWLLLKNWLLLKIWQLFWPFFILLPTIKIILSISQNFAIFYLISRYLDKNRIWSYIKTSLYLTGSLFWPLFTSFGQF